MDISQWLSYITEENLMRWMNEYRALGPLASMLLPFLKSFIPPLPTIVILGVNAAVYGLWVGFIYSWIGITAGSLTAFWLVRKLSEHRYLSRLVHNPKVVTTRRWIRNNGFNYIFLLSLFPVGPFTLLNVAAGLSGIRFRSFLIAIIFGRGIMVFAVSFIGADLSRYRENPWNLLLVLLFVIICFVCSRSIEAWFSRRDELAEQQ